MQQENYKKHPLSSKQRGIALIEVLISILLMAIIGLGGAFIAGRTAVTHRDQNIHLYTISQMRYQLESSACTENTSQSISIASRSVAVNCNFTEKSYTVAAYDNVGGGVASSASGAIKVRSPKLAVQSSDTFVPVQVEMAP